MKKMVNSLYSYRNSQDSNYRTWPSFTMSLHGWDERFPAENLLNLFESYFTAATLEPQEVSFQTIAEGSVKSLKFKTLRKRLSIGQLSDLASLSLYHFVENDNKGSEDFYLRYGTGYDDQTLQFVNAVSPEVERRPLALEFLRDMLKFVTPCYGYSLEMPLGHTPSLYALGMFGHNDIAFDESYAWQHASKAMLGGYAHKQGRMRHVFAINVLSRPHMEARMDGKTFGEWVRGPNRGTIQEWKDGVWVWQVPKEHRIRIAAMLHFNGILTTPEGFQNRLIG